MPDAAIRVLSAGVDWITATVVGEARRHLWRVHAEKLIGEEVQARNRFQRIVRLGYEGKAAGSCWWGERNDSAIMCVSGPLAAREAGFLLGSAEHVSRVDIELTAVLTPVRADVAEEAACGLVRGNKRSGFPLFHAIIRGSDGGSTLYIGRRSSAAYARIYNKGIEAQEPAYTGAWRWELEGKDHLATTLADSLRSSVDRSAFCAGYLHGWFTDRGIAVPWECDDVHLHGAPGWRRSDYERTLEWLRGSVRPAIDRLCQGGMEREVERALGVDFARGENGNTPGTGPTTAAG